ncbi:aldehyde dehydrogenase family protein [SAR92 clade bacterium H231]|nr:aldehyde dehydrogenase family protein [SAR92 clade bacterium H231]
MQTASNGSAPTASISEAALEVRPLIEGDLRDSTSEDLFEVVSPSTGEYLLSIPTGSQQDVDRAVASARTAFDDGRWCDAPPSFKKKTLHRFADLIAAEAPSLDALDAEEMGKPISLGFCNAAAAASLVHFYAEAIDKLSGDLFTSDLTNFVTQRRVPHGVVAAIVPWNFPSFNTVLKVAPALAAGNCVVLKPSELSSRSGLRIAQLALEAGLPQGVFNVVPGLGETVGQALGLHHDVDMLAFTGSSMVGKLMLQYAGQSNMKVVTAECGGKSPHIVFADGVDLDAAADGIAQLLLLNQGQVCSIGTRLLVQHDIEATLIEKVSSRLHNIVPGDALDPKTTFGPLVTAKQCAKVMQYIDTAPEQGAELVMGGGRLLTETGGYFVAPTVFRNVSPTAGIAQEEIFGPVLSVTSFKDTEEAIQLANSTQYGLASYVWTASLATSMKMAKGIRSSVFINACAMAGEGAGHALSSEPAGQSGLGTEGGLAGMESYMRRQLVGINHG